MVEVVILAAGKGTRMCSNKPKVLHTIAGKSFLRHVIDRSNELAAQKLIVVVGHGADAVKTAMRDESLDAKIDYVEQKEQRGTGHAALQALPHLSDDTTVLILYGDVPLIKSETLNRLAALSDNDSMALLTVELKNPFGYGRIIRSQNGEVESVVEEKDATPVQQSISEINTGFMAVRAKDLKRWLPKLSDDNTQGEYLLPDIISAAVSEGKKIHTTMPCEESEVLGINNRYQQAELERIYQRRYARDLLEKGLRILDPARFDCRGSLTVGSDCVVDVNCVFEGDVVLGNNVSIGPNCHIIDANIADNTEVKAYTSIEKSEISQGVVVGPYARLRPQTLLKEGAKVGNFVEIKKTVIGKGSKVNHLSYVGDATVGDQVNIGAGTITCNYDGINKFQTTIENGTFVGSNTALVAPVSVGENATIGAGSVITSDVSDNTLAVGRSRQRNIDGWARPTKK